MQIYELKIHERINLRVCINNLQMELIFKCTSANDVHFQTQLLEGIVQWNEDRATVALTTSSGDGRSFSGKMRFTLNCLGEHVLACL